MKVLKSKPNAHGCIFSPTVTVTPATLGYLWNQVYKIQLMGRNLTYFRFCFSEVFLWVLGFCFFFLKEVEAE